MRQVARSVAIVMTMFALSAIPARGSQPVPFPNLLHNGTFEADWSEELSHRVLIFPPDGSVEDTERGNIFTPPGWVTWFYHDPGTYDQPEVRDAWVTVDPVRVHSGQKAILLFTFFRRHHAGFLQQVDVQPGALLTLSGFAHAWSNWQDGDHPDDPRWSDGSHVGYAHACLPEGMPGLDAGDRNFTFYLGIDPTGGLDPFADTVIWGAGMHAYNEHCQLPEVELTATMPTVTVFLRSVTLWPFKHNDAYWDDVVLTGIRRTFLPLVLAEQ